MLRLTLFIKRNYPVTYSSRSFWTMIKDILQGDDHRNPQKILERNYLYLTLLLNKAKIHGLTTREVAQQQQLFLFGGNENETTPTTSTTTTIDTLSNSQLRQLVQKSLEPDLLTILEAFHRVDSSSIAFLDDINDNTNKTVMQGIVVNEMGITENDLIRVQNQVSDSIQKNRQHDFLIRKKNALELLIGYCESNMNNSYNNNNNKGMPHDKAHGLDALGTDLTKITSQDMLERIRSFQLINICRSLKIKEELGYSLWVLPSTIPNAGRGCFVDGRVPLGSMVAFQPGQVWCKEHLVTNDPEIMQHFDDGDEDCQISLRFDDYIIDSRRSPVIVLNREGSMNPWALGHMVNHPPKDAFPNCHCSMLNYTERTFESHEHLLRYIPNSYARPLGWQSQFFLPEPIVMHGLCLISRRDLENEELLYDYRLQSEQTPDWYSVVQYGDETLDKEQVVFFRDDWRKK